MSRKITKAQALAFLEVFEGWNSVHCGDEDIVGLTTARTPEELDSILAERTTPDDWNDKVFDKSLQTVTAEEEKDKANLKARAGADGNIEKWSQVNRYMQHTCSQVRKAHPDWTIKAVKDEANKKMAKKFGYHPVSPRILQRYKVSPRKKS